MVKQTKRLLNEVNTNEFVYLFKPNVQGNVNAEKDKTDYDGSKSPDIIIVDDSEKSSNDVRQSEEAISVTALAATENLNIVKKQKQHYMEIKSRSHDFRHIKKRRPIHRHRSLFSSSKILVGTVPPLEILLDVSKNFRKPISVFNLFIAYWKQRLTRDFVYSDALSSYSNMSSLVKSRWKERADKINATKDEINNERIDNVESCTNLNDSTMKTLSESISVGEENSFGLYPSACTISANYDVIDLAAHFKLVAEAMQGMSSNLRALAKFGTNVTVDNFSSTLLDCAFTSLGILSCLASEAFGSQTKENVVRNSKLLKNLAFTMPGLSLNEQ